MRVAVGDQVSAGQELLVIEAMKMQHVVRADRAGRVAALPVTAGAAVEVGAVLAVLARRPTPGGVIVSFTESAERQALRESVRQVARKFGVEYAVEHARRGQPMTELWQALGAAGFLGVNLPAEYGGGGAGIYELALVLEEVSAEGCAAHHDGGLPGHRGNRARQVRNAGAADAMAAGHR